MRYSSRNIFYKWSDSNKSYMIGITYHKDYNKYDLGMGHPLVGDKPTKTMEFFEEQGIMNSVTLFAPNKATEKDLLRAHSKNYVNRVKELSKTGGMLASDTPAPIGIYDIASLATGGSILAGEKLFEGFNIMANPLAGFHHAGRDFSSGFCFFNDIAVTIEYLREKQKLKKFLVIDLDVHHGNGTQDIYSSDPTVLNLSFHQDGKTLYPGTGSLDYIGRDKGEKVFRYRIGMYRILYKIKDAQKIILISKIDKRPRAYK